MARTDELSLAWSSLSSSTVDADGWRYIDIPPCGPCQLRAGRRSPGNEEALLAGFSVATLPAAEKLPAGQGFGVERLDAQGDGKTWIGLSRRASGSGELFLAMARDVAESLDDEAAAGADERTLLRVFLGRVRSWQEFMRKGAQPLSAESEVGLVGELTVLASMIRAALPAATAIAAWVGPLDGLRDFEIGTGGLEVKSTTSAAGFTARVGTLAQLDDTARQPLFVAGVRLRQVDSGATLPASIAALRDITSGDPEAARLLAERALAAGYLDAHRLTYTRRFSLASTRIVEVSDGFPRLTLGSVPSGVLRASYEIDLEAAPGLGVSIEDALNRLGAL